MNNNRTYIQRILHTTMYYRLEVLIVVRVVLLVTRWTNWFRFQSEGLFS